MGLGLQLQNDLTCHNNDQGNEIRIPMPWGHIAGKWWGSKAVQPIIAVHGWQDNCGTFDGLASFLMARGHSILCIDLPGHGFSSHLPPGHNYYLWWDGVHYLRRIIKRFKWKDVQLLGHSLGGGISFLYAAAYPSEVKRYLTIDTPCPPVKDVKKSYNFLGKTVDKFLSCEKLTLDQIPCYGYDDMLDILVEAHKGSVTREGCKILLRRGMRPATDREGYWFTRDSRLEVITLGFLSPEQVFELASRITCEVANIRATEGQVFDVPSHYPLVLDTIEKQAKKVERHVVQGTHHLHLNNPESIVDIVHHFFSV